MDSKIELWSKKHQQALKKLLQYYLGKPNKKCSMISCPLCDTVTEEYDGCKRCYWYLYEVEIKHLFEFDVKNCKSPCETWFRNEFQFGDIGYIRKTILDNRNKTTELFRTKRIAMLQEAISFWEREAK